MQDPAEYSFTLSSWFNPFSWEVWLLLVTAYFVSSCVLWLVGRFSPMENKSTSSRLVLKDSFWYLIACWFRASPFHPKAWSTRLMSCAWWMFYITVIFTYFIHLPPHLATPKTAARPKTVQQALDLGISFGVVRGGSTYQLLKVNYVFHVGKDQPLIHVLHITLFRTLTTLSTRHYGKQSPMILPYTWLEVMTRAWRRSIVTMEPSAWSWNLLLLNTLQLKTALCTLWAAWKTGIMHLVLLKVNHG